MNPTPLHRGGRRLRTALRDDAVLVLCALCTVLLVAGGVGAILWDHSNANLARGTRAYQRSNDATLVKVQANQTRTRALAEALRKANLRSCRRDRTSALHDNEFNAVLRALLLNGVRAREAHAELPTTSATDRRIDLAAAARSRRILDSIHDREIVNCAAEFPSTDTPERPAP